MTSRTPPTGQLTQDIQPAIFLSTDDYDRLVNLATAAIARSTSGEAQMLLDEVYRADLLPTETPTKIVAMNSHVEFRDERTGTKRRVQLVFPYQSDIDSGRLSVLSPIGAALIGMAEGQSIVWQLPTGRPGTFTVLRVSANPFADDQIATADSAQSTTAGRFRAQDLVRKNGSEPTGREQG